MPTEITAALLGALIGVLLTFWFALRINRDQAKIAASTKLRSSFAGTLATIAIERNATPNNPNGTLNAVLAYVKNNLLAQASAFEEFRPFVSGYGSDGPSYQKAWDYYCECVTSAAFAFAEQNKHNLQAAGAIERAIHELLSHAKT